MSSTNGGVIGENAEEWFNQNFFTFVQKKTAFGDEVSNESCNYLDANNFPFINIRICCDYRRSTELIIIVCLRFSAQRR